MRAFSFVDLWNRKFNNSRCQKERRREEEEEEDCLVLTLAVTTGFTLRDDCYRQGGSRDQRFKLTSQARN